jgi:hypothetical protein
MQQFAEVQNFANQPQKKESDYHLRPFVCLEHDKISTLSGVILHAASVAITFNLHLK